MYRQYLDRHGFDCVINRDVPVQAKVAMKHTTRGVSFGKRDSLREGTISLSVEPGETFSYDGSSFIILSSEPVGDAYSWFGVKANSSLSTLSQKEVEDEYGNVITQWVLDSSDIPAFGEVVTAQLRQTDPGLLPTTTRIFLFPSIHRVSVGSRLIQHMTQERAEDIGAVYDPVHLGARFKVDSVDDQLLFGIYRVQVSIDTRGD